MNRASQRGFSLSSLLVASALASLGFAGAMVLYAKTMSFSTENATIQSHDKQLLQSLMSLEMELLNAGYGIDDADDTDLVANGNSILYWRYYDEADIVCNGIQYLDNTLSYLAADNCSEGAVLTDLTWGVAEIIANFPESRDKPAPEITFSLSTSSCTPYGFGPAADHVLVTINAQTAAVAAGNPFLNPISNSICAVNTTG